MDAKPASSIKNLDEFIAKINEMKRKDAIDLSIDEDLSIAIMNLVGIEEHFFFTAEKTGNKEYYNYLCEVREMRKELLKMIMGKPEGEIWCVSKHLLAASYRLMEAGAKQLTLQKKEEAYGLFAKAFKCYTLFWGINMGVMNSGDIKKIDEGAVNKHDKTPNPNSFMGKFSDFVKKTINCCKE